jgi:uncharacterized protein with ParB-like and HNH nuclease domain/predicted transport protein
MKAIDQPFTKIIDGAKQFIIPVFQRDYSWTETQCEQLWDDVTRIGSSESDKKHFLGSLVYVATERTTSAFGQWLLIDGQQRLTTLTLLLAALRDHIRETEWTGDDDGPTAKRIEAYFLKNMLEDGPRSHKLVLRRHDQATLHALIDNTDHPAEPSERISDNYSYFREQIASANPAQVYRGVGRLVVVDVTLDRQNDDPQLVFESLNSTGIDLSQSDLIRNYILMRLPETEQTQLYEAYWSKIEGLFRGSEKTFDAFVRDYIAFKTQASRQEKARDIHQAFRRLFPGLVDLSGDLDTFLIDMLRFARYYAAFSIGGNVFPELTEHLGRLRRLVDAPAILMMRLFDCYDEKKTLSVQGFKNVLQLVESFILRRAVCGGQTHNYWQVFANLAYRINDDEPTESLKVGLVRQRDSSRFPTDEEFCRELQQRDLYGLRVCAHLLDRLENHGSKEPTETSGYSIEHILPQNEKLPEAWRDMLGPDWKAIHETWIHRLGNLTLTGYNSTYSDRPFDEKKTIKNGFGDSSVRLNKFVREQAQWTPKEMQRRGELLTERALEIWPALHVASAAVEAAKQEELRALAARRDVSKVPMSEKSRELFDQLSPLVRAMDTEVLELAEKKSVSYHASGFFLEVLPRKHRLLLSLPLEYSEVDDPLEIAHDATEKKFYFYANYEGGVTISIVAKEDIEKAMPLIRQSLKLANT